MQRPIVKLLAGVVLLAAGAWGVCASLTSTDEVVMKLGEPYEQVRKHSRSTLPPWESGDFMAVVTRPAAFRFDDAQYGFTTPAAKFLSLGISGRTGKVDSVTLSPQVEVLRFEDAIAIVMDLQTQWRRGGWRPFQASYWRPIEDTVKTRRAIQKCEDPTAIWNAGIQYQVSLNIRCFRTDARLEQERYLITVQFGNQVFEDRPTD